MKKIFLTLAVFFLCYTINAQQQLTISQAVAYKVACKDDDLSGYWLDIFGKKVFGQEYVTAKNSNDEFKLNRLTKSLTDKYTEAKKGIIGPIFYVTELIDNYQYDFDNSSVKISFGTYDEFNRLTSTNDYDKLDVYIEGGVRRNWMTKGYEADDNPVFKISNAENIPTLFEMPVDSAEKSFNQRKGSNRPAFKLRYYFRFWQCGSKFDIQNFGGHTCDVEVVKVELIDDIIKYKKTYDIEPGEQPAGTQENSSSNNENSNSNESNSSQQTNSNEKKANNIYTSADIKIVEGFIDLNRVEMADKEYFISQFNQKGFSLFAKSKLRFEQSKDFDDILIAFEQKGKKPETQSSYMYYRGILFERIGNYLTVVRKLQNGIGSKMFTISPPSSVDEIYFEK